eukprot:15364581-Ditylum_brightwellii.AAC.1
MQLSVDSDTAYLVMPGAKSCYAGHFYLESSPNPLNYNHNPNNTPAHTKCKALKNEVCSAAEEECNGLFHNGQLAIMIRGLLQQTGNPQAPTKIKTDNSTANSFVHSSMHVKRSKSWDMALKIYWDKSVNNDSIYFTKHHLLAHHKANQPRYILKSF